MTSAEQQRRNRLRGIALICGTFALFACLDSTAKYLSHVMDPLQVTWARYAAGFALAIGLSNPFSRPELMKTTRPWLQLMRSLLLLACTVLNFLAVKYLQLDQTTSIGFATPFLVALLSGPMLGEWVGWRRWIAISIGFCGVLLVARPGFGGIHPAAGFSVAAMFCYGFYFVTTRVLARTDSSETTLFYSNIIGVVVMTPIMPFVWTNPDGWFVIALMVLVGALGTLGHYLLIIAHRWAPPSVLAPFMYTQLLWVIGIGYVVFGDVPAPWTLAGAAIVIASGLYLLHRERVTGKPVPSAPPPE
jgi:drug/metabolite transporter (DMT)-like permease